MTTKIDRLIKLQENLLETANAINIKLEKVCAMLVSDQILQETISPEGEVRSALQCAEIVKESFNAGLCMSKDLDGDHKHFQYSVSEFFVDDTDDDSTDTKPDLPDISNIF
jgi:hypothetical protein